MATKQVRVEKPNRISEILKKEYRWESFVLLGLSLVIIALAGLILNETLVINKTVPVIGPILGTYPTITVIVLYVLGFVGTIVAVWPIFKPSFKEGKKLSLPTLKIFKDHAVKVFSFIIGLIIIFLIYDTIWSAIINLVK